MKQEQNSANGDHNSVGGKTDATRQPTPLVVKTAIAVWIFLIGVFLLWLVIGDYVSDRAESIKLFIASIFSLAIVIVVVIQTVIYFKQSEIMKDQWQAMRDAIAQTREQTGMTVASIIISQSSYVGIADLNLLPSNQILIKIENRGAIPAEGVKLR